MRPFRHTAMRTAQTLLPARVLFADLPVARIRSAILAGPLSEHRSTDSRVVAEVPGHARPMTGARRRQPVRAARPRRRN